MAGAKERTFHVLVYSLVLSSSVCQPSSVVAIVDNMHVLRNRLLCNELYMQGVSWLMWGS